MMNLKSEPSILYFQKKLIALQQQRLYLLQTKCVDLIRASQLQSQLLRCIHQLNQVTKSDLGQRVWDTLDKPNWKEEISKLIVPLYK